MCLSQANYITNTMCFDCFPRCLEKVQHDLSFLTVSILKDNVMVTVTEAQYSRIQQLATISKYFKFNLFYQADYFPALRLKRGVEQRMGTLQTGAVFKVHAQHSDSIPPSCYSELA